MLSLEHHGWCSIQGWEDVMTLHLRLKTFITLIILFGNLNYEKHWKDICIDEKTFFFFYFLLFLIKFGDKLIRELN